MLLFFDELRDIWEWLVCECEGLESVEQRAFVVVIPPTPPPPPILLLPTPPQTFCVFVLKLLLFVMAAAFVAHTVDEDDVVVVVVVCVTGFWNAAMGLGVTVTIGCTLPTQMTMTTTIAMIKQNNYVHDDEVLATKDVTDTHVEQGHYTKGKEYKTQEDK